jgi:hypothetical protein
MSFFEDASLVLIPSAYKDQKVYSVKPTDGTGDLTFSRASSATRVQSDGLIEKVRTNLILQSQTFENASWAKVGVGTGLAAVVTANAGAAPDGTTTADRIVFNTGAGTTSSDRSIFRQSIVLTEGSNGSFYIKSNTGSSQSIGFHNGGQIDIVTATTSWQRFNVNISSAVTFFGLENRGDNATAGTCDVLVWGAQLETGDIATDYIATTTAAVSVGPVSGLPRLDYLGSTCPRLLLEPQRTNTITFSEDVASCLTSQVGTTVTANATASPDGYQSADLVAFTPSSYRLRGQVVAAATTYTMSVFFKNNNFSGTEAILFNMSDGVIGGLQASIQPANGTATYSGSALAWTSVSGKVENYGNGWYRVSVTGTSVSGGGGWYELASISPTKSAYFWGFSLELGAYATSYIPTLGASVTRVADAASKTGISSLIGQTEGTIYWEGSGNAAVGGADLWMAAISVDDTNVAILLYYFASAGTVNAFINNGTTSLSLAAPMTLTQNNKLAVAYKNASFALYLNGALVASSSSAIAPPTAMNQFAFVKWVGASNQDRALVNQALLFKTRLTNAQLAELTA